VRLSSAFDRREFLRRALVLGASLPGASLLSACTSGSTEPGAISREALPYVLEPIESGLEVEHNATLHVYEWKNYLSRKVVAGFERAYASANVHVLVESFQHIDEAVARIQDPSARFDVVFPTIDVLRPLVEARLLLPLNHEYLPNIVNLWTWFRGDGPFYDPGLRYTTPYTVYSSGVGWRADLVAPNDAPDAQLDPFAIFWNPRYRGKLGLYDEYLEALSLSLLHDGVVDLHAATDLQLRRAADGLRRAVLDVGVRFTDDGAEEGLPEGAFVAHQAWSGDILTAHGYGRKDPGVYDAIGALRYRAPQGHGLVVGCDLTAICSKGHAPVLAHAFLNHLLAFDVAMDNFSWNGYQPPLVGADPEAFADPTFRWHRAVPSHLLNAIITAEAFENGQMLVGFSPSQLAPWVEQWDRVSPRSSRP
jgi:spermidine/putrescine transport system substrate-binding protein